MAPRLVFRCDASPLIGSGHVMRCLSLADAARRRGCEAVFVSGPETVGVVPALTRSGWPVETARGRTAEDAGMVGDLLKGHRGAVIIDGYRFPLEDEEALRREGCRILVLDDLADRPHACDLLLNSSPGFSAEAYRGLVPAGTRCLLGPRFALVGGRYAQLRPEAETRRSSPPPRAGTVLVNFGGTDPANATVAVLRGLAALPGLAIHVAMGRAAPSLPEVAVLCGQGGATLHVDAVMPDLILQADIAVGAGGASAWERCCLGLPSLIMTIADNQRFIAQAADQAGAALDLGPFGAVDEETWRAAFLALSVDRDRRAAMSRSAMDLIDGRGADRVMDEVLA